LAAQYNRGAEIGTAGRSRNRKEGVMAAFARGPDRITGRLNNLIENLQGDKAARIQVRSETKLLLEELDRYLGYTSPKKGASHPRVLDHAAEAGMDRVKLALLREVVMEARADVLRGDPTVALKRFKQARDYWMTGATDK
jgi:hypothetical protein